MLVDQVNIDVETYSELDLAAVGAPRYSLHPSTKCLMMAYSINGDPVKIWDIEKGEIIPGDLQTALNNKLCTIKAYNAEFERNILENVLGIFIPLARYRCTMVKALGASFPAPLDKCAEALSLGGAYLKDSRGKSLIRLFSKPNTAGVRNTSLSHPEEWEAFKEYCKQDVVAEKEIDRVLPDHADSFWQEYVTSCMTNVRGLPVKSSYVKKAIRLGKEIKERVFKSMQYLTELDNPNSGMQLKRWLADFNIYPESLDKASLARLLDGDLPDIVREVLQLKSQLSKTSISKYEALERAACPDNRIRGCFQFCGAGRTGRDAGRIFQPQNLPRGTLSESQVAAFVSSELEGVSDTAELSSLIRSSIQAPPGRKLLICDLNAIETRVAAWATNCKPLLHVFFDGLDPYKSFAAGLYNVPYGDVDKQQRTNAKPAVLGCIYRMGATRLRSTASAYGVDMTEEQAIDTVQTFRDMYPAVVRCWYQIDRVVQYAVETGRRCKLDMGGIDLTVESKKDYLYFKLPSSRRMYYAFPEMRDVQTPWGATRKAFTYMGVDSLTKKWVRQNTHGGKLFENLVQAIARDVLYHGVDLAEKANIPVVGRVHDELICEVEKGDMNSLPKLRKCMTTRPGWAHKLPLAAEGFESKYYKK